MMPKTPTTSPAVWFWVISVILLVWAIGGASIYIAYFLETPEQFARSAETAANSEAYARYVEAIPGWAIAAGIIAAGARLFAGLGLLLRRAWAAPLYVVSAMAFAVALYRAFVIADAASAMSPAHVATEGVFLALSLFAIWFSYSSKARGVLR
jgi:hypothetical protein